MSTKNIAIAAGVIVVLAGGFIIMSGPGDDKLAVPEDDFLLGEPGDDIIGGPGADTIVGRDEDGIFDDSSTIPIELVSMSLKSYNPIEGVWFDINLLDKEHGIGHADSPCPDYWSPLIMQFPGPPPGAPGYITIDGLGESWIDFPGQVDIPLGGPTFPPGVGPPPGGGTFSDPFFVDFSCDVPTLETQDLDTTLTFSVPGFDPLTLSVNVTVLDPSDWPEDQSIFTDGFESGDVSAWSTAL